MFNERCKLSLLFDASIGANIPKMEERKRVRASEKGEAKYARISILAALPDVTDGDGSAKYKQNIYMKEWTVKKTEPRSRIKLCEQVRKQMRNKREIKKCLKKKNTTNKKINSYNFNLSSTCY